MNRSLPRIAILSLSLLAGLAACKKDESAPAATPAAAGDAATPAAPAGNNDKIAVQITGAGATFIYPLLSKWSDDYNKSTGAKINYQSIGSGGGIAQIKAGTVDFGSSDKPLPPEELAKDGLAQFPSAVGGVVPVVNVQGIEPGKLRLTGTVLADIFLGKISAWNDPAIAALNPGLPLPSSKINVVHRSDGSGTTYNFVNYLSKVSPEWKAKVGEGTSVNWPGGVGGKGNEGVAAYVKQIKGSIGYVELAYATENKMAYAGMQNAAGNWVQPSAESFAAAIFVPAPPVPTPAEPIDPISTPASSSSCATRTGSAMSFRLTRRSAGAGSAVYCECTMAPSSAVAARVSDMGSDLSDQARPGGRPGRSQGTGRAVRTTAGGSISARIVSMPASF
mgnify:CR=1 FL=1